MVISVFSTWWVSARYVSLVDLFSWFVLNQRWLYVLEMWCTWDSRVWVIFCKHDEICLNTVHLFLHRRWCWFSGFIRLDGASLAFGRMYFFRISFRKNTVCLFWYGGKGTGVILCYFYLYKSKFNPQSIKLCCQRKCLSAGKCIPVTCAGYASNRGIPQNNSKFWFGWSISMFDAKYSHFQGPMHVLHAQQADLSSTCIFQSVWSILFDKFGNREATSCSFPSITPK